MLDDKSEHGENDEECDESKTFSAPGARVEGRVPASHPCRRSLLDRVRLHSCVRSRMGCV